MTIRSQRRERYDDKTASKSVTLPIPLVERAMRQAFREGHKNFSILTAKALTEYLDAHERPNGNGNNGGEQAA